MISGFVDSNIVIGVYRNLPDAKAWYTAQTDLAVSSVVWLEIMEGASGKAGQKRCLEILSPLELVTLTDEDQRWAMEQILRYRLSHGLSFKDCLIASSCHRLQAPVYTLNVKDFLPILGSSLVIKPY